MTSSVGKDDHGAGEQSNRQEVFRATRRSPPVPMESEPRSAVRTNGDLNFQRTAVVADTPAPKTEGDYLEPPMLPLQDQQATNMFLLFKIITWVSAVYMSGSTWAFFYKPSTGAICPYREICATTWPEKILLTFSRLSAGALFSALAITMLSKCYSTRAFLHHSWFGAIIDIEPSHDMHTYFGYLMLVAGVEHGVLHIIRWSIGGDADLLYSTNVGRSGVICMLLLFPIVLPMKFQWFKDRMRFETRKGMHMLSIPMLVGLCFHSTAFCYVSAILIGWYAVDRFYFTTKQTFLIQHPTFEAVGRGTMVGLDLPPGYDFMAGSYIYVNCPAISHGEWHPFSIIPVPGTGLTAAFYAEVVGDWTRALFRLGLDQPRLPLWITAAQPSAMDKTIYYDHVVLICTGAGITPGISIAQRYAKNKEIHLLWITRDSGMVALFEKELRLVRSTVYLTGKPDIEVKLALSKLLAPAASTAAAAAAAVAGSLVSTGSNNSGLGLARHDSNDSARRLDGSFKEIHGNDRPASILEKTRASLLNGDAESVESSRGPPPVLAALTPAKTRVRDTHDPRSNINFVPVPSRAIHPTMDVLSSGQSAGSLDPSWSVLEELPEAAPSVSRPSSMSKWLGSGGGNGSKRRLSLGRTKEKHNVTSVTGDGSMENVKLVFGRPDIKEYLLGIFLGKPKGIDDDPEAPVQSRNGAGRHARKPSDDRLDGHQQRSKAILLAADKNMIQSCKANGGIKGYSVRVSRSSKAPVSDFSGGVNHQHGMGRSDPPLVLYCGANPKVEEVIEATCSENCVSWKKEYFGTW